MLNVSLVGVDVYSVPIVVTSGRELILNIELTEGFVRTDEVVITANKPQTAINEAAIVSSIEFTVDDASRYAGKADPTPQGWLKIWRTCLAQMIQEMILSYAEALLSNFFGSSMVYGYTQSKSLCYSRLYGRSY